MNDRLAASGGTRVRAGRRLADVREGAWWLARRGGTGGVRRGRPRIRIGATEPGRIAVGFLGGKSAVTCIDNYWYGVTAAAAPWWVMTSGEARLAYAYAGTGERLREHLQAMLDGQEVVITVVQFHADRQKVYKQRDIADFKNVLRGRDCPICRINTEMVTTRQAGLLFQVKPTSIRRWIAQGTAHGVKTPGGQHRVCKESLFVLQPTK